MSAPVQRTRHIQIAPEVDTAPPQSQITEFFQNCLCCTQLNTVQEQPENNQAVATPLANAILEQHDNDQSPLDRKATEVMHWT